MKVRNTCSLFLSLSVLAASAAMAADTAVVNVSASVTGTCKFVSGGSINFALDPTSAAPADGAITQPSFWCTKGTDYTIADDKGLYASGTVLRMKHESLAEYIPYSFNYTAAGTGEGKNSPLTLDIAASVANADFVNASVGNYADVITLSIEP